MESLALSPTSPQQPDGLSIPVSLPQVCHRLQEHIWHTLGVADSHQGSLPLPQVCRRLQGDQDGLHLLGALLTWQPERRITAGAALCHPWFRSLRQQQHQPQAQCSSSSSSSSRPDLAA